MHGGSFSRRALLGAAATTALTGCSEVTERVPEELDAGGDGGAGDGGATGDDTSDRAIVTPIFRLITAYNRNLMSMAEGFLTPASPVREQVTPRLLEAYEVTGIEVLSVDRRDETSASVRATLSYRSVVEDGASFTTRFENRQGEDHWLVHDIDDPAPILSLDGIPTATPEPTPASEPLDGFEGSLAPWTPTIARFGQREDEVYAGSYSGGITADSDDVGARFGVLARARPPSLAGGRRPRRLSYYWLEREENTGGGLRVRNSKGAPELGVATANPGWVVDAAMGRNVVYEGDGYDRWVKVDVTFDWEGSRVEVAFEDLESGTTASRRTALGDGLDAEIIQVDGFTKGEGWVTDACHMFWDEVSLEFDE
ncbi:hypothetical protein [Haloglomus litoreum]|uniref:hypothetical protein n=1 Tax=Haloglomus litoreum TaxID=3034026 RepID=UPI0023E7D13F|nr:hypothetical protein [Haloglomus sp. DT116]